MALGANTASQRAKKKRFEAQEAKKARQSKVKYEKPKKKTEPSRVLVGTGAEAVETRGMPQQQRQQLAADIQQQQQPRPQAQPQVSTTLDKAEFDRLQAGVQPGQEQGQEQQQQGWISKALQAAESWFKGTPLGAAITGTEFQAPDLSTAGGQLDIASSMGVGGGVMKLRTASKALQKATAKYIAQQEARQTLERTLKALGKQASKPLVGNVARAAAGASGRDAAGKITGSATGWGKTIPPGIYQLYSKTNTKKASLTKKVLKKLGLSAGAIGLISGYLFSIPWSLNEKSDAVTTIKIAQRDAAQAGDWETVAQYDELINEVSDISWLETLMPFYNVGAAVMDKFKAAKITSEKYMEQMKEDAAKPEEEEDDFAAQTQQAVDIWKQRDIEQQDYNTMDFERKKLADEEMQQFWQDYLDQKQAGEEEAREFWAEYQKNKQEFWAAYKEQNRPSNLGFGLL